MRGRADGDRVVVVVLLMMGVYCAAEVRMPAMIIVVVVMIVGILVTAFGVLEVGKRMAVGVVVPAVLVHNERQPRRRRHHEKAERTCSDPTTPSH